VCWHPADAFLGSCTTDTGVVHIFDIRTDRRRPAILYDTCKKDLYAHQYRDCSVIFLGFGDGQIQVFDIRSKRMLLGFRDPYQAQVGDIRFNYTTKRFAVFGSPCFTLWSYDDHNISLCNYKATAQPQGLPRTSGEFRVGWGSQQLAVTDSGGTFTLVEYC
jgi:hypothetical protein